MGGGPLMDLNELFMVEYAFKKAKKLNKITALLGCGVGPLFNRKFRKSVLNISKLSDIVILRDSKSKENLEKIYAEFSEFFNKEGISTSFDPAVECCLQYDKLSSHLAQEKFVAVNLRKFPKEYSKKI